MVDEPFRELFDLSPDAILLFDSGVVVEANQAAVELLRAPSLAVLLGCRSRDLVHPDSHALVEQKTVSAMSGERTRSEEKYIRFDGTVVDVEVTAAKARWRTGKAFIIILRDLSERVEAEAQRQRERESALRSEQALARERSLREILDLLPTGIFARDADGMFVFVNKHAAELSDSSIQDMLGRSFAAGFELASKDLSVADEDRAVLEDGEVREFAGRVVIDAKGRHRTFDKKKLRVH